MLTAGRPRWRTFWRPVFLGGGVLLAACSSTGSYQVSWAFVPDALTAPGPFTPGDCGAYGVAAISVVGISQDGARDEPAAACAPGVFTHRVPPGTWTLTLAALNAEGRPKAPDPADSALLRGQATVTVVDGEVANAVPLPVVLVGLPQCRDGVDNNRDGRVDLDDPNCAPAGVPDANIAVE